MEDEWAACGAAQGIELSSVNAMGPKWHGCTSDILDAVAALDETRQALALSGGHAGARLPTLFLKSRHLPGASG